MCISLAASIAASTVTLLWPLVQFTCVYRAVCLGAFIVYFERAFTHTHTDNTLAYILSVYVVYIYTLCYTKKIAYCIDGTK